MQVFNHLLIPKNILIRSLYRGIWKVRSCANIFVFKVMLYCCQIVLVDLRAMVVKPHDTFITKSTMLAAIVHVGLA
jgi:hypothetical protein